MKNGCLQSKLMHTVKMCLNFKRLILQMKSDFLFITSMYIIESYAIQVLFRVLFCTEPIMLWRFSYFSKYLCISDSTAFFVIGFYKITKSIYTVTSQAKLLLVERKMISTELSVLRTVFAASIPLIPGIYMSKENHIIFVIFKLRDKTSASEKFGYCNVHISFGEIFVKVIYKRFSADG